MHIAPKSEVKLSTTKLREAQNKIPLAKEVFSEKAIMSWCDILIKKLQIKQVLNTQYFFLWERGREKRRDPYSQSYEFFYVLHGQIIIWKLLCVCMFVCLIMKMHAVLCCFTQISVCGSHSLIQIHQCRRLRVVVQPPLYNILD